ncbi:metal-sulfur cluster assembly factor [Azospirillum sp. sgz302134]
MNWKRYLSPWTKGEAPGREPQGRPDGADATPSDPERGEVVREALRTVNDPEVGLNIVDLGLVYAIHATAEAVQADITLTTPTCPLGETVVENARAAIAQALPDLADVTVRLVWEPRWTPSMMSDHARGQLGW